LEAAVRLSACCPCMQVHLSSPGGDFEAYRGLTHVKECCNSIGCQQSRQWRHWWRLRWTRSPNILPCSYGNRMG